MYSLGHRLLGFLLFVSNFYAFGCFWCVCPPSSGLSVEFVPYFSSSASFLQLQLRFSVVFPSILFWYCRLLLLLSSDLLGFASVVGFAFFLRFRLWLLFYFTHLYSLFRMLRFGLLLVVFLSIFPHAVATVDCFRSSSTFFRLQFWLSLPVSFPLFSQLWLLLSFLVFVPVFPHPAPPAALCFWQASCCLPCCRFSVGGSLVVWVLLSLRFCSFSFARFSPPASFFFACPSGYSSSCLLWCSSLRLRFFLRQLCLALFGVALWFSVF